MMLSTVQEKVAALLDVLDEDIRHIEVALSRLDTLRTLLIKRDDASLEKLLDEIRKETETYATNEQQRQMLRKAIATHLGRNGTDLTLSEIQTLVEGSSRKALQDRQVRLKSLTAQLRREYTVTAVLLSDCARFNRSLMQAFFGPGSQGGITYSPSGTTRQQSHTTLMSMQF